MSKLTLAQANKIVEVALKTAREMKVKPLAVAVIDEAGHVKSLQRENTASISGQISQGRRKDSRKGSIA